MMFFLAGLWVPGGQGYSSFTSFFKCWSQGWAPSRRSGKTCCIGVVESQPVFCKQGLKVAVPGLVAEHGVASTG